MIRALVKLIPLEFIEQMISLKMGYPTISYGPNGEDAILRNMLRGISGGFYIDVGAYHPNRFSNTRTFYNDGWSGINIDAMPGSMKAFMKERPRDINLESAVSDRTETLTYHVFAEQAYNTFSHELATECVKSGKNKIREIKLDTMRLVDILDEYMPKDKIINLLSIDVEGYDMAVLRSNDWIRYLPEVIAIEEIGFDVEAPQKSEIFNFLKSKGYHLEVAMPKTIFFRLHK